MIFYGYTSRYGTIFYYIVLSICFLLIAFSKELLF